MQESSLLARFLEPRSAGAPPKLALGTMNFGGRTPEAEAHRIVAHALESGITLLDTANTYTDGSSEKIVGAAIHGRREEVVLATKVGLHRIAGRPEGLSPARILAACDESLLRLKTDAIDLYYLHAPDPRTPIEESLTAVKTLLDRGKIRAWGVSNYASWQILEMFSLCDKASMPRPCLSQLIYNLLVRQLEIEYFKFAARFEMHTTVYNPLAGGLLTERYQEGQSEVAAGSRFDKNPMYQRRYWSPVMRNHADAYRALAAAEGMTLADLAYAWVAGQRGVDSILVGPGTVSHLEAAMLACGRTLAPETRAKIDATWLAQQGTDAKYAR